MGKLVVEVKYNFTEFSLIDKVYQIVYNKIVVKKISKKLIKKINKAMKAT